MLIVRGINIYPSQVESAIVGLPQLTPHYQLVATRERALDELEVLIEVDDLYFNGIGGVLDPSDERVQNLLQRAHDAVYGVLGISTRITLMAPGTVPRSEGGKLRRVVDLRKM
jgi:phenylacetate-CoA ligase